MVDEQVVGQLLRQHWGLADVRRLVRQPEAMNSLVWLAELDNGQRTVVKAASERERLESGLRIAQAVQQRGIAAGAPWPAHSGALTVPADGWEVAVLSFVAGRPIDPGRREDAARWGAMLGCLHRVLRAVPVRRRPTGGRGPGRPPATTTWPRCQGLASPSLRPWRRPGGVWSSAV
jgi:Ser/Thr protein kinase RdoA (MazF antagonist)